MVALAVFPVREAARVQVQQQVRELPAFVELEQLVAPVQVFDRQQVRQAVLVAVLGAALVAQVQLVLVELAAQSLSPAD